MLQYVNRYFAACNPGKNEIVLSFSQEAPIADLTPNMEPGVKKVESQNIAVEEVASLVMTMDCAQNLMNVLQELLSQQKK